MIEEEIRDILTYKSIYNVDEAINKSIVNAVKRVGLF